MTSMILFQALFHCEPEQRFVGRKARETAGNGKPSYRSNIYLPNIYAVFLKKKIYAVFTSSLILILPN